MCGKRAKVIAVTSVVIKGSVSLSLLDKRNKETSLQQEERELQRHDESFCHVTSESNRHISVTFSCSQYVTKPDNSSCRSSQQVKSNTSNNLA